MALAAAIALAGLAGACGAARHPAPKQSSATVATRSSATVPSPTTTTEAPRPKPRPNPGSLPQTHQLPSAGTRQFHAEMAALWAGIAHDSPRSALPAFFPVGAYVQVKAIADPRADYVARLIGDYRLDIAAAHDLLGPGAHAAKLLGVRVPQGYAHWVSPGACENRIGYYEVPNARILYTEGGAVRSFGIASMISWRGVWYVVHLGSVLRTTVGGVVDDPATGPGQSVPSSTC